MTELQEIEEQEIYQELAQIPVIRIFIFTVITFGIYPIYWFYIQDKRINKTANGIKALFMNITIYFQFKDYKKILPNTNFYILGTLYLLGFILSIALYIPLQYFIVFYIQHKINNFYLKRNTKNNFIPLKEDMKFVGSLIGIFAIGAIILILYYAIIQNRA